MAHPQYSIGENQFLSINGERQPPKQMLELDERPGVNGTEITRLGKKGKPFSLRTFVDAPDYESARVLFDGFYVTEIGLDPVELVVADISSVAEGYRVAVLDVRVIDCGPAKFGTTGINPPSEAYLECEWDLLGIPL